MLHLNNNTIDQSSAASTTHQNRPRESTILLSTGVILILISAFLHNYSIGLFLAFVSCLLLADKFLLSMQPELDSVSRIDRGIQTEERCARE